MKRLRDFFVEDREWKTPHHTDEHDEVHTQAGDPHGAYPHHVHKMLNHLKNPENYHKAMKSGKPMKITPMSAKKVGNTDAGSRPKLGDIDKTKHARVTKQFKSGKSMQKPIVLHDTHTGHTHLLAGNTRLTHNTYHGSRVTPVHAIKYDSSKMHKG